ncbi:MAG TPA: glycosyltransferase family 4 protein, partial [Terriglobales bacterium]|nr:glycosyltransferase family 4 protein [Terriglobales bacterium]
DVRDWRHALNEAEQLSSVHIVHAHSFAAAIAGVRGSLPSAYDFSQTLEEITTTEGASAGAWLLRSFRVAEQFALSRASAVVTHAQSMARLACERGTSPENVFVVPDPFPIAAERLPDRDWAAFHGIDLGYHSVLFALPSPDGVEATLLALAEVLIEVEQAILLFELSDADRTELLSIARQINVADNIRCIAPQEHDQAVDCSDVILIPATSDPRIRTNPAMLEAMAAGKAVVAADVPENRECSPDGHGVIWFNRGDTEDLAQRAAFVARNSDFSRALGESGRSHIRATRSPQVIGRRYDNIYKYALSRRRDNLPKIPMPQLYTANVRA